MSALMLFAWVALKRFPMGKQVKAMDTSDHLAPGSNAHEACLSGLVNGTAAAQMPREALENQPISRDNGPVIADQGWGDGWQAARLF